MRRAWTLLILLALIAGCTGDGGSLPTTVTPPETTQLSTVMLDGRWGFDADEAARRLGVETGRGWMAEASFGRFAGAFLALDETAARLANASVPASGTLVLHEDVAREMGVREGDAIPVRAVAWPAPLITTAFEMDRVRPCDAAREAALCSEPATEAGARLSLRVPPGSFDLRYHPDVVELRDQDYPAFWNGTFTAPDGARIPFHTAARTRTDLDPPGLIAGPLAAGVWAIEFTLDLRGERAPGAIAGFVTHKAPGFAPFDTELLRGTTPAQQTRAALGPARVHDADLVVAQVGSAEVLGRFGAVALVAPADALRLLGMRAGNATLLLTRDVGPERLASATDGSEDPAVAALRLRPYPAPSRVVRGEGVSWVEPAEADLLGGRAVAGGVVKLNGTTLAPGVRLLSLPASPPWSVLPGGHWPDAPSAVEGAAAAPHLVLASEDLLVEAGVDPMNARYAKLEVESALGPRSVFVMGATSGGPPRTIWASAALLAALTAPSGGRAFGDEVPVYAS